MKIKTFLPVFTGFYNTIWSLDEESFLSSENQEREDNKQLEFEDLDIDYKQYEHDISVEFCSQLENVLQDFIVSIEFEKLCSPKTYNFSTDSIDCIIEPKIASIRNFLFANKNEFIEYLKKNYTSYDGFISGYANDFESWAESTKDFKDFSVNGHVLGSILQFIYNIITKDDADAYTELYYNIKENVSEYEYITINK